MLFRSPISFNEIKSFEHMNSLTEDEINRLACAFVDGYIKSFELAGIDLTQKETVQIRYPIGFERMVICACNKFEEHGLCPVIARSSEHVIGLSLSQSGAIDTNPQAAYDHRYDKAIFFNRAIEEKLLQCMTHAYEEYKHEARVYAGPAVIEYFGEEKFNPINKPEAISFNNEQQKLQVEYSVSAGNLVNQFINRETFSFTIIALPVPSIGDKYTDIFKETLRINTLDIQKFDEIQTSLIDVLDLGEYVQIKGAGKNKTDLKISLQQIFNPERESGFHNCLAACNIPVGEVYTSPKLKGTEGLLHVSNVFINGLEYKDLQIHFRDGMTEQYSCNNYEDAKDSKQFIYDNLMRQHKTLPMGEFAIGTNTAAYSMGKRFQISEKLPILIAEKIGRAHV